MSHPEKLLRLQQLDVRLRGANTVWREVLHLAKPCRFIRHHTIRGVRESGFFFVTQGSLRICYTTSLGQERSFMTIGEDCMFNEISVFTNPIPGLSFVCIEPVVAWKFSPHLLNDASFYSQNPKLLLNLLCSMSRKLNTYFFYLSELRTGTSLNQLCTLLLLVHSQHLPISQSELGLMLGIHQTTVSRLVRYLRHKGAIGKFTKNFLEVRNEALLCEMADAPAPISYGRRRMETA